MSDETTQPLSRADRLHAIVAKVAPAAAAQHATDGTWPNRHPNPGEDPETGKAIRHAGAPYVISEYQGKSAVSVISDDGDVVTGRGATLDEAIATLEGKVGLTEKGADRS